MDRQIAAREKSRKLYLVVVDQLSVSRLAWDQDGIFSAVQRGERRAAAGVGNDDIRCPHSGDQFIGRHDGPRRDGEVSHAGAPGLPKDLNAGR